MTSPAPQDAAPPLTQAQVVAAFSSLGWAFDLFDLFILLYVAPVLAKVFFPSGNTMLSLAGVYAAFTATLPMRPLGGSGVGKLLASLAFLLVGALFPGREFEVWGWRVMFFTGLLSSLLGLFVFARAGIADVDGAAEAEGDARGRCDGRRAVLPDLGLPADLHEARQPRQADRPGPRPERAVLRHRPENFERLKSGVGVTQGFVGRLVEVFGADHVTWGSGAGNTMRDYSKMVDDALAATRRLNPADRQAVLASTGRAVFSVTR